MNTHILKSLIQLRFRQFYRMVKVTGIGMVLFAAILLAGVLLGFLEQIIKTKNPIAAVLVVMAIISTHFTRKDRGWLESLSISKPSLFFAEYFLILLPFIGLYAYLGSWLTILMMCLAVGLISFINPPNYQGSNWTQRLPLSWIPDSVFEFKCGLRKHFVSMIILYFGTLALSIWEVGFPLGIIAISLVMIPFFEEIESKEIIKSFHLQSNILWQKTRNYAILIPLLFLPHILMFLFFYSHYWYFVPVLLILAIFLVVFCFLYKYASYGPGKKRVYNALPVSFFLLGLVIPFFFPVTLFFLIFYWRKAQKNLDRFYA